MKTAKEFYLQKINPDNERFKNDPIHSKIIELMDEYASQYCDTLRYTGRFLRKAVSELKDWPEINQLKQMRARAQSTLEKVDEALETFLVKNDGE